MTNKFCVGDTVECVIPLKAFDIQIGERLTISDEESKKLFEITAECWAVVPKKERIDDAKTIEVAARIFGERFVHDTNKIISALGFRNGAEWQKKRMIIKVCKWFNDNACNYFGHMPAYPFVDDLRKAMED